MVNEIMNKTLSKYMSKMTKKELEEAVLKIAEHKDVNAHIIRKTFKEYVSI